MKPQAGLSVAHDVCVCSCHPQKRCDVCGECKYCVQCNKYIRGPFVQLHKGTHEVIKKSHR